MGRHSTAGVKMGEPLPCDIRGCERAANFGKVFKEAVDGMVTLWLCPPHGTFYNGTLLEVDYGLCECKRELTDGEPICPGCESVKEDCDCDEVEG